MSERFERLLTLNEVAEQLRTPPATLRFWRHQGTGPVSFRLGKRVIYKEEDVRNWLEQQYTRNGDPAA